MNASSNADSAHELLIRDLAADLAPVRRLRPPYVRTFSWLAVVAATAVILAMIADLPALGHRLAAAPDLWLAVDVEPVTASHRSCLLYTSPSPRDRTRSRMPSSA